MILDLVYINKDLYIFNQVKFKPTYLSDLNIINIQIKGLCHLINILSFIKFIYHDFSTDKVNVHTKKRSSYIQLPVFHPHYYQRCSKVIYFTI